jgi:hypothetical protein
MAGLSVVQGIQGYQQNSAMAKAATRAASANIANEKNSLAIKQKNLQRQQEIETGRATVAAAGSGATLGSFDALFEDNTNMQLMDRLMLDYDSKLTQENIRYNAAVQKSEFKSAARSSLINGAVGAAGSLYQSPAMQKGVTSASNTAGQKVGSIFSKSKTGPYLNYGSSLLSGY